MWGSNDRLRRVRGYGRHRDGARVAAKLMDKGSPEDDTWTAADVGQPFTTLVKLGIAGFTLSSSLWSLLIVIHCTSVVRGCASLP